MATASSEVFLEIGECKDKEAGTWGQPYLGGDNGSKYTLAGGSSGQVSDTKFLFRLQSYGRTFLRSGGVDGSKTAGRPDALPVGVHFECNHTPVFNLIQAFFGESTDNLINFHIHLFREFSGSNTNKRERHIHIKTISGWAGRITQVNHSVGGGGDEMYLSLAADRWRESIWKSAKTGSKIVRDHSHVGEDIERGTPM
ncbi:MAG: hypothetical protein JRH20_21410 [Deltaproteobacteria bacterium]|nr:hypothetical protein [Deltaproteobacteria bacterium]